MSPGRFLLIAGFVLAAACQPALPEPESAGAVAYRERCGGCHGLYAPSIMKAPMWEQVMPRMEKKIATVGQPLSLDERHLILDYLTRNAR